MHDKYLLVDMRDANDKDKKDLLDYFYSHEFKIGKDMNRYNGVLYVFDLKDKRIYYENIDTAFNTSRSKRVNYDQCTQLSFNQAITYFDPPYTNSNFQSYFCEKCNAILTSRNTKSISDKKCVCCID